MTISTERLHAALRRLARSTDPPARYRRFLDSVSVETDGQTTNTDAWMTALVLLEDIIQCQCEGWISRELDSRLQAQGHHAQRVHHAHHAWADAMATLGLAKHELADAQSDDARQLAVLTTLLPVFPWQSWLATIPAPASTETTSLQRWQALYQQLHSAPPFSATEINHKVAFLATVLHQWESDRPNLVLPRPRLHWGLIGVEGMSERYVIPAALKALGLSTSGLMVVDTGGKGPMVNWVQQQRQVFSGPITLILDADGAEEASQIQTMLGTQDHVCCLPGTLEDSYPDALMARVINHFYEPVTPMTAQLIENFRQSYKLAGDNLALYKALWEFYELTPPEKPGPFDKVTVASHIADRIATPDDVSPAVAACLTHAVQATEQRRQATWQRLLPS